MVNPVPRSGASDGIVELCKINCSLDIITESSFVLPKFASYSVGNCRELTIPFYAFGSFSCGFPVYLP
jgi:hypothetical protein